MKKEKKRTAYMSHFIVVYPISSWVEFMESNAILNTEPQVYSLKWEQQQKNVHTEDEVATSIAYD